MTRQQVLDLYFMETRSKLIDLAAFLDRLERAEGPSDFRAEALKRAMEELLVARPDCARRVLMSLSDPTTEPVACASTKGAVGAWDKALAPQPGN